MPPKSKPLSGMAHAGSAEESVFNANAKLKKAESSRSALKREVEYWRSAYEEISEELETVLELEENQSPVIIEPRKRKKASQSVAVLCANDWHSEETVERDTVNGLNEFDLNIADKRIQKYFDNALYLIDIWRGGTDIEELVLWLGGDFMTGHIHEELVESNGLSPTQTVLWVLDRIQGGINLLRDKGGFRKIRIICNSGNHGRNTPRKRISTSYKNSYEWLMYNVLAKVIADPAITFLIPQSYHAWATIYGRDIRFHHGDYISYGGGVGGISIPVNKAVNEWNKARKAYLDVFGHFHQRIDGGHWICSSSLIGYNPYALSIKAGFDVPSQTLFFMERDKGKSAVVPVFVE